MLVTKTYNISKQENKLYFNQYLVVLLTLFTLNIRHFPKRENTNATSLLAQLAHVQDKH